MKRRKIAAAVLLFAISAAGASGCQSSQETFGEKVYAGVTCYDQSDTFVSELLDCFKEELESYGGDTLEVNVTVRDAAGSQRTQNDQVKELLDGGCNVLCVNLVDRADPSEIIDLAREQEVPVIFFNREPVAEDMLQWDRIYYVGADAKQSGVMQGELVADVIQGDSSIDRNRDGKIQYVVLEGEAGHQDAIIRTENAVDTLRKKGIQLEKLSYGIANWNRAQAQTRMMQIISEHPNKIELVLANNDDMALGALDAYEKLNVTESALPVFFGIDGTEVGLEAVADSRLSGTVYNDKEGQGEAMAKLAVSLITGKGMEDMEFEKERYVYLPYSKVTSENVSEFIRKREP